MMAKIDLMSREVGWLVLVPVVALLVVLIVGGSRGSPTYAGGETESASPSETAEPTESPDLSGSASPTETETESPGPSGSETASPSPSETETESPEPTGTESPEPTETESPEPSETGTATPTVTATNVIGDVDCTGAADDSDILRIIRVRAGLADEPFCWAQGDLNNDTFTNLVDALLLLLQRANQG